MKSIYTPNDFKDLASDAKMIQAAVDAAAEEGVSVVIPRFNERTGKPLWEIDETIVLHTGSDVQLEGCHIRLADDTFIHFFSNDAAYGKYWRADERQYDITLTGRGNVLLDGGKHNGIFEKNFTIYDENGNFVGRANPRGIANIAVNRGINFRNVERVAVSGLRFINQRYWAMNFEFCAEGHLYDITFDAPANVPNQDGIDIRTGCHNFLIENIFGRTGDDTVALTNFGPPKGKLTEEELAACDPDIHDVIIKNIRGYLTDECDIIRILNRGGFKVYNVHLQSTCRLKFFCNFTRVTINSFLVIIALVKANSFTADYVNRRIYLHFSSISHAPPPPALPASQARPPTSAQATALI